MPSKRRPANSARVGGKDGLLRGATKRDGEVKSTAVPNASPVQRVASPLPIRLQQQLLDIFHNSFPDVFDDQLSPILQEIKSCLYTRDFKTAFGREDYLAAYAVRWSPSRALGYVQIFSDIMPYLFASLPFPSDAVDRSAEVPSPPTPLHEQGRSQRQLPIAALGAGAGAEVVALAGLLSVLRTQEPNRVGTSLDDVSFDILALDVAPWLSTLTTLSNTLTTAPSLSAYASATALAANKALVPASCFAVTFKQHDLLSTADHENMRHCLSSARLITLMFTLNELYTTSLSKTQYFLQYLTSVAMTGALLLVVDSPGSYSTVAVNGKAKKYPMSWLLDYTLLRSDTCMSEAAGSGGKAGEACGTGGLGDEISEGQRDVVNEDRRAPREKKGRVKAVVMEEGGRQWQNLVSEESRWFRLPKGLKYPIELEDMRYQIHLYRHL